MVSGSSRDAGCCLFTRVPSLCRITGPCVSKNTAGAYFATVTLPLADAACPAIDRTTIGYRPAAKVGGNCALICVALVASKGTDALFTVTHDPPSMVGNGV